jgi:DTW domain-containing protein YfiP
LVITQVGESKNTVHLIQKSLETCEVLVGRRFSAKNLPPYVVSAANKVDEDSWRNCLLVWPSTQSEYLGGEHGMGLLDEILATRKSNGPDDDSASSVPSTTLVLIDGTWASCSHIFMNSPLLQKLRRIRISPTEPCRQVIA